MGTQGNTGAIGGGAAAEADGNTGAIGGGAAAEADGDDDVVVAMVTPFACASLRFLQNFFQWNWIQHDN